MLILLENNRRQQLQPGKAYAFSKKAFCDMFEKHDQKLIFATARFPR